MHVLSAELIEYLESQGYSEPVAIDDQIRAFHPGNVSGVMPSPIPEAIAIKVQQRQIHINLLKAQNSFELTNAWYRRNKQVEIWFQALPLLRKFHCEGCGVIHYRKCVPNHCDRCQDFLEKERKIVEDIPF